MHNNFVLSALLFVIRMSFSVDAFSFDNFIDPLLRDYEELKLEDQLSELGRVVDDAARNLFNLTIGTSTTLSHANALLVIFIIYSVIFAIFSLTFFAASSIFTGMNEENGNLYLGELISSETANHAARLFLSYINSTTTISASYALVIILGISIALLALLGLAYMTASAIFTGTSVQSYYGKRSLPDGEEGELDLKWTRIVRILYEMEENFSRLEAEKSVDCRKRLICQLFKINIYSEENNSQRNLMKLTNELSDIYQNNKLETEKMDLKTSYESMKAYNEAKNNGELGDCMIFYPKCDSY